MGDKDLEGALETVSRAVELHNQLDRRGFLRRAFQVSEMMAGAYILGKSSPASASLDDRISLAGTSADPKHEEFVNYLKDYIASKYVTKDFMKEREALTELRKYGIAQRHAMNIREINEFLIPMGMFLVEFSARIGNTLKENIDIHEIHKKDKFEAYVGGEHISTYDRVLLGKILFSTKTIPGYTGVAGEYKLGNPKKPVIFIPYLTLKGLTLKGIYGSDPQALTKIVDHYSMHEVGHAKYRFEEEGAELFALSAGMDRKVRINDASDIVDYLNKQTLTYNNGPIIIDVFGFRGFGKDDPNRVAGIIIQKGLIGLSKEINSIDSKYTSDPRDASDQQLQAMAKILFDRFLMKNPIYRLSGY